MRKIIDISGYGHSGKTAITDYLKQFDSVFGFPNYVEFELFRVPGGLVDLYHALYDSWNLIRSRVRLNEFDKLIHRIGRVQTASDPLSYFYASAHGYDQYFNNRFIKLSEELITKIITGTQKNTFWPYENLRVHPLKVFINKFKTKFFRSLTSADLYYSDRNQFVGLVSNYVDSLMSELGEEKHTHVILNNAFDPFNPSICLNMINNGVSIVVERDPRDIYASQINTADMYVPDFEKTKTADKIRQQFTGFNDIEYFIFRYKTIRDNVIESQDSRILRLRFEDFVLDHEIYSKKVLDFVGLDPNTKKNDLNYNLQNSSKSIGLWKKYVDLPEIKLIGEKLSQFCYNN
ncbi:hypothetical protein DHW03_11575 [Pedobacter yonginense]|uniref:Sulfotransferase n=1 Tax=Pedobacter yonginense TaxID=651869 RepID=A0A317ENP3_9SPHI|nr:sulfotransferase [Pedobacter yonginense]PWS28182.1 hypothetical protein DHW03_11575 [Pedobacter yonginense]